MVFGPGSMALVIVAVLVAFPVVGEAVLGSSVAAEADHPACCVEVDLGSLGVAADLCDRVPAEALGIDPRVEGVLGIQAGVVCSLRAVEVAVPGVGVVSGCACVLEGADLEGLATLNVAVATRGLEDPDVGVVVQAVVPMVDPEVWVDRQLAMSVEAEGGACDLHPNLSEAAVVSEAGTLGVAHLGDLDLLPVTPPDPEGVACAEDPEDPSREDHHRPACDDGLADLVVGDALHPVRAVGAPLDHPGVEVRAWTGPRAPCCAGEEGARGRVVDRASGEGGPGAAAVVGVTGLLHRALGLLEPGGETTPLLLPPADRVAPGAPAVEAVVLVTGAFVVVQLLPRKQNKLSTCSHIKWSFYIKD